MKAHNIIKCVLALSMAVASVTSCQEKIGGFAKGEAVRFSVGTDAVSTKAVYSGQGTSTIERIDWQEGDLIRICCEQVSEPSDKFADYRVTSGITASESNSTAHIEGLGGVGLRWGDGNHTFYAVYPSPEEGGSVTTGISIGSYENGGTKSTVSESIAGAIVTANLPAKQAVIGGVTEKPSGSGNYIAAPDLKNMLMTAKSAEYSPETGITDDVFLSFTPLTTAIKFTITNQTEAPLTIKSVSLTSAASALSGPFEVNMDSNSVPASIDLDGDGSNTGDKDIKYSRSYPECTYTGSVSDATKTVTINFASPVALAYDSDPAKSGKLTFTFFLQPCQDFSDLTFKLVKNGGEWMSTKLGYTDGTGVLFPRFKKTTVKGILVPEGAQWTVKYAPGVEPWGTGGGDIYPTPEVSGEPIVTSWDTGKENEKLKFENSHGAVYIGGKWWATMNVGATTVAGNPATCYGDFFAWGEIEPYYSSKTISSATSITFDSWKSGKSAGYDWASYSYCTGVEKTLTKYNDDSTFGNVDNKTILESADDAATANWGGTWRTPTMEDFIALCEDCDCTFENYASTLKTGGTSLTTEKGVYWCDDYDGVPGVLFSNGTNKVFFPSAGRCSGKTNDSNYAGKVIRYWSSKVYEKDEAPGHGDGGCAWGIFTDSGKLKYDGYGPRQQGRAVRPVHD